MPREPSGKQLLQTPRRPVESPEGPAPHDSVLPSGFPARAQPGGGIHGRPRPGRPGKGGGGVGTGPGSRVAPMRPPQLGPGDRSPTSGRTGSVGGDPRYTWWVGTGDWPTGQVTVVTSGQAVPQPVQTPCVRLPLPVLPHVCGPRPPGAVLAGRASPSPFLSFKEVHETQAG